MPYNTRRKSLNLPNLGIQLPSSSRAHRPSISKSATDGSPRQEQRQQQQPPQHAAKRVKRSHSVAESSPISLVASSVPATPVSCKTVSFADRPRSGGRNAYQHTPPPSPGASSESKIDYESINDDIVAGVIEQLETTGNRPHLIRELSTVLTTTNESVAGSANPAALLSSRLAAYMRRSCWAPQSPCPVAKELIPVHPRKVFYYLTTKPRRELPSTPVDLMSSMSTGKAARRGQQRIISPSISDASHDDDDACSNEDRKRASLSPSPELDLSFGMDDVASSAGIGGGDPSFSTPPTPGGSSSFSSARNSIGRESSGGADPSERDLDLNRRAKGPPLEGDEREFEATVVGMRLRGMSMEEMQPEPEPKPFAAKVEAEPDAVESDEERAKRNSEAAAALFGGQHAAHDTSPAQAGLILSSPLVRAVATTAQAGQAPSPQMRSMGVRIKDEQGEGPLEGSSILGDSVFGLGWDISRPENVDLDELSDMLDDC